MQLAEYLKNTTQAAFAMRCRVSQSAVSQWVRDGVPFGKVRVIFEASDGKVTPHDCFPDMFPVDFAFPAEVVAKEAAA